MQRPSPLEAPTTTVLDIFALSCNESLVAQRIGVRLHGERASPEHCIGRCRLVRPGEYHNMPSGTEFLWRKNELDRLMVGVEAQQERDIQHPLPPCVAVGNAVAVEEHRDRFRKSGAPGLLPLEVSDASA